MNCPTLAAFAPGVLVAGKIVSATSSRYGISSSLNASVLVVSVFLQPVRNASAPTTAPPVSTAIIFKSSLLSIFFIFYFTQRLNEAQRRNDLLTRYYCSKNIFLHYQFHLI